MENIKDKDGNIITKEDNGKMEGVLKHEELKGGNRINEEVGDSLEDRGMELISEEKLKKAMRKLKQAKHLGGIISGNLTV